jgi:hypothetical protein
VLFFGRVADQLPDFCPAPQVIRRLIAIVSVWLRLEHDFRFMDQCGVDERWNP